MTNGDRIRAMTDEELAKMGDRWCDCNFDNCPVYDICFSSERLSCYDTFLNWLKAEEDAE